MTASRLLRAGLYAFLAVTLLLPALRTAAATLSVDGAFSLAAYAGFLDPGSADLRALLVTILLAILSVVLSGLVGVPLALALHRRAGRLERLLFGAALLPLALPPLIGALSVWFVYGPTGILSRGLEHLVGVGFRLGPFATVLLVHVLTMYPIFLLFTTAGLARRDPALAEAARGLGASPRRTLLTVTLPSIRPQIRGAALLVFLSSTASFSAPYLFAPDQPILSVRIVIARLSGDLARSQALTTVLTLLALAAVVALRPGRAATSRRMGGAPEGRASRAALAASSVVVLLALLPVLAVGLVAFSRNGSWTTTWLPTGYTLENFARVFAGHAGEAVASSLWMAAAATAALLVVGVAAGYALRGGGRLASALVMLPWALPGTVVAVNLIGAAHAAGVGSTIWLLPLAWAVRALPLMARATESALARVPPDIEEAARGLGAGRARSLLTVTAPLAGPGILAGAVLVFAFALGEYTASVLLYGPGNVPISIAIAQEFRVGNLGSAAALGTLLVVVVTLVLAVAGRVGTAIAPAAGPPPPPPDGGAAPANPRASGARPSSTPPSGAGPDRAPRTTR